MSKTRIEETNNIESSLINNEATDYVKPKKVVKAKIELTDKEKKVLYWHSKGQSVDWIAKALQLHANRIKEIIDANV